MPRFNRAALLLERGEPPRALEDLNELLRLHPRDVDAYLARGRAHLLLGAWEQALADNQAVLAQNPDEPRALNNLAWLWATCPEATLRDPERALEMAHQARALSSGEDPGRLDTLAACLAARGEFIEAVAVQERACELAGEAERDEFLGRLALYRAEQAYVAPRAPEPEA